jgi:hypothetical protein
MFAWIGRLLGRKPEEPLTVRPLTEALAAPPGASRAERKRARKEVNLAKSAFFKEHPFGIALSEISVALSDQDLIQQGCSKLVEAISLAHEDGAVKVPSEIRTESPDLEKLGQWLRKNGRWLRLWHLARFFSLGEIAQLQYIAGGNNSLYQDMVDHPFLRYFIKLELSMRHWKNEKKSDSKEISWPLLVKFHQAITAFDFGLKGFEITVDYCKSDEDGRGWGVYTGDSGANKGWLDSELALIVSHKGKKVMMIGVSPSLEGLLVNQIQLCQNKGNRWLYKLPLPYFEYVLSRMLVACRSAGLKMLYPTGESVRSYIGSISGTSSEVKDRIKENYDRELTTLEKSAEQTKIRYLTYHTLTAKPQTAMEPAQVETEACA